MPAHTSTSLKPRADRNCQWRPSRSSRFVLQLENQFRATGDETGELGKTPGAGSNKAFIVVTCGAARALDSCRIAIYGALRNWRSSRLFGAFNEI